MTAPITWWFALAGTSVRLRSDDGAQSVVLIAYLMACPEFSVVNGEPRLKRDTTG